MPYASNEIMKLSGSTGGQPILAVSTGPSGTTGTTVHTVPAGKTDRVELWAWNNSTSTVRLTLQLGTNAASREKSIDIPPKGSPETLVLPYLQLEAGQVISAFASVANMICLSGHVNERTPAA